MVFCERSGQNLSRFTSSGKTPAAEPANTMGKFKFNKCWFEHCQRWCSCVETLVKPRVKLRVVSRLLTVLIIQILMLF